MKKSLLIISLFAVTFFSCDRDHKVSQTETTYYDTDNTEKNIRDRNTTTLTPLDQSESETDRTITQKIRKVLIDDRTISTNGKNIKVITIKGVVTLRGPVASESEKDLIEKKVKQISGVTRIDNQLEPTSSSRSAPSSY